MTSGATVRRTVIAGVALLALGLAGCSSSDDNDNDGTSVADTTVEQTCNNLADVFSDIDGSDQSLAAIGEQLSTLAADAPEQMAEAIGTMATELSDEDNSEVLEEGSLAWEAQRSLEDQCDAQGISLK